MSGRSIGIAWPALLVAAVLAGGVATPAAAEPVAGWRVVDLGVGDNSAATAINGLGHVVGDHGSRAFLWRDGQVTYLDPSGGFGFANDVNNNDEVVGDRIIDGNSRAFLWRNGTLTDLGVLPGGTYSSARAINDRGEVVGYSTTGPDGLLHGFRWHNGVLTDLGVLPGAFTSIANDINKFGVIVGESSVGNNTAVRWVRGSIQPLADVASASAVNDRGHVTGLSWDGGGPHGFLWYRGQFTEIPAVPGGTPFIQPWGINNRVQIVGDTGSSAFVWEQGQVTVLPPLRSLAAAKDINDQSQIVGSSWGPRLGDPARAVIWTR